MYLPLFVFQHVLVILKSYSILLGCQIILNKELEGIELTLPQATRNFYVDGHVPEPH